jgi:hypothetical protein
MVAQGVTEVRQSFASLPVVAAYQKMFVRLKFTEPTPLAEATTAYDPVVTFAVKVDVAAIPPAPVFTEVILVPVLAKVPLAPLAGAVKVTLTLGIGLPLESSAVTFKGFENATLGGACCPSPSTIERLATLPSVVYS